jgi:HK97 gp10 family phage protein
MEQASKTKMAVSIKIEGLSDLVDGLTNELPKATAANVQKRALKEAADPIEAFAKQAAPVRTGKLRDKINISTKLSPRQKSSHKKESKYEIFVGPPSMARGIVAEFGSVKQSPHPFMRPAWDANKKTAFSKIGDILAREIEKARQRAARKAAKLAGKT